MSASAAAYRREPARRPERVNVRAARAAGELRRKRAVGARHLPILRIVASLGFATVAIAVFLALQGNATRMNYELSKAVREQTRLVDANARLDDKIARLESRERLALLAAGMHMHEAGKFTVAVVPAPRQAIEKPHGLAFLPIADWLR